jgi:competence protein ComEA
MTASRPASLLPALLLAASTLVLSAIAPPASAQAAAAARPAAAAPSAASTPTPAPASTAAAAVEQVDINRADAAELARVLVGVGAAKAALIVEYREANGPFRSAEQLVEVSGIGLRTVERNIDRILVGEVAAAAPAGGGG